MSTTATMLAFALAAVTCPPRDVETIPVSLNSANHYANDDAAGARVSAGGRYVVFHSAASNLHPSAIARTAVYLRDTVTGTTELISLRRNEAGPPNLSSAYGDVSADGRYVVFESSGNNVVSGDTNGATDVFLRDRHLGTTRRLSQTSTGAQLAGGSMARITPDGRYVILITTGNLEGIPGGPSGLFRLEIATHEVVQVATMGTEYQAITSISISDDGRYVAFTSLGNDLVPGDTNNLRDAFVKDLDTGSVVRVSLTQANAQSTDAGLDGLRISLSGDASVIALATTARDWIPSNDSDFTWDFFARTFDPTAMTLGSLEHINTSPQGDPPSRKTNSWMQSYVSVSRDGRYIAFASPATNLAAPAGGSGKIFVRDRLMNRVTRVSLNLYGNPHYAVAVKPQISSDGRYVVYESESADIVAGSPPTVVKVYRTDLVGGSGVGVSFCAATVNSSGRSAHIVGSGSSSSGDNDLTVEANTLPANTFGFFLASLTQRDAVIPAGSEGALCLGGAIGRFVASGQIQNSGPDGRMSLGLDLAALPQPTASIAASPGETWNFQGWFRDVSATGQSTSNFTNGLSVVIE